MLPNSWSRPCAMISVLLILCYCLLMTTTFVASQQISLPGCPSTCGKLTIPYPFGIGTNCARKGFDLNCNFSSTPPKTYLNDDSDVELLSISLLEGKARVRYYRVYDCYSSDGTVRNALTSTAWTGGPYTISNLHNKLTVIGCDSYAFVMTDEFSEYTSGCLTVCNRLEKVVNGSCSGIGCCQTAIPKGLQYYNIKVKSFYNHTKVWRFNPCSYAFLVDQDWFEFSATDITPDSKYRSAVMKVPVVLNWVAGNESCKEAVKNKTTYACLSEHSVCYDSTSSATGYLCNCSVGYEGNPYLRGGCQDINECMRKAIYPCKGVCMNNEGGYDCICPKGTHGDPKSYGCIQKRNITKVLLATIMSSLLGAFLLIFLYGLYERKKRIELYEKNGGTILEEHMLAHDYIRCILKVYTKEELEKATNKFDEKNLLGLGGQGMVYKGTLKNESMIAIKKSKISSGLGIKEFINEIIILSQINHRNVVRLLGCCLEVKVPYLVYEYMPNNTLFYHIHNGNLTWGMRLRIAMEVSGALAYLHTKVTTTIYHQDIKSSNILLDRNFIAKVSDFGASKLVQEKNGELSTIIQGTPGYMDPEYLQTHEITDKSDVYSFGVVLLELLTGREPICSKQSVSERYLVPHFKLCMEKNELNDILDKRILINSTSTMMDQMIQVSKLATQCIHSKGKKRPDMTKVSSELEGLQSQGNQNIIESQVSNNSNDQENGPTQSLQGNNQTMYYSGYANGLASAFEIDGGR